MSEPFAGEIRMFAGSFAPRGWAFCDGQLISISQNDALFSLFGTIYGGDGRTTFGLPDLRGRIPVHAGTAPGLSNRRLGEKQGAENVTLTEAQLPAHTHPFQSTQGSATTRDPVGNAPAGAAADVYVDNFSPFQLSNTEISSAGGSQPHTNLMPSLCVHFIVALFGIYPSRT